MVLASSQASSSPFLLHYISVIYAPLILACPYVFIPLIERKKELHFCNSLFLWCHQHCLRFYINVNINDIHIIMWWIISFAPLISYGIMGILHRTFLALIPLADSQSSLYNAKLAIIRHNYHVIVVKTFCIYLTNPNI